jgi:hypothetical protein
MSAEAGVIFRTAFDDPADVLDQIESGQPGFTPAETCGQRLPHDLRLRNATLAGGSLQVRANLVWDLAGDRGHNFLIIRHCAVSNTDLSISYQ